MKVLHVISDTNIGGAGVLLCTLLRHFEKGRVESVVALPKESALRARLEALQVPMLFLQAPCDRLSQKSVHEIEELIRRENIDIVHANAALCARVAGRRCGVGVLHTRHCCFPLSGIYRFLPIRVLGGLWNRCLSDRVIATAEAAAEDLLRLGVPHTKIEIIINGSEPIRTVGADELALFRKEWRLNPDDFTVGICARLVACKGHDTFLYAAKQLLESMPNIHFRFLIAGEGEERERLEALAFRLGIHPAVRFLGFLSDTAPFYRLLRVNVNCSSGTETSCLALSEGMSVGVPMVVSDYGGNPAMLGDSNAGFLYPVGDADALAKAICKIAADRQLEDRMRREAEARYRTHYTAQSMTERVTAVYESMMHR